jgi:hypothetical protein
LGEPSAPTVTVAAAAYPTLPRNDRRLIGFASNCNSGFAGSPGLALRFLMTHPFCGDSDADLLLFDMPAVDAAV